MSWRAAAANRLWRLTDSPRHARFRRALARPREAQESILRGYLARNASTAYGLRHGFSGITSCDAYRQRVPLTDYDDYTSWIDRIARGEQGVLTAEPVKLLEPTSGSTGAAKWIPFTARLQSELRNAVAAWVVELFRMRPELQDGPAYWAVTPALKPDAGDPRSQVPRGFADDAAYLGGAVARLVSVVMAVPPQVARVRDAGAFKHATLLHLLGARDLRLISVWHPSFLCLLLDALRERWHDLLADLERGPGRSAPCGVALPRDPGRARELAALDPSEATRIWPRLALVSAWGDAHARTLVPELERRLPGVTFQAKGLIATEACVSLPFAGRWPLAVTAHFFEFLEPDGRTRFAWELEPDAVYSLVVTTGGGLYRYRMRDRVTVTGFLSHTPCLEFLGKEESVSDVRGEKLDECFVAAGLARAFSAVKLQPSFALLAPEPEATPPRYVLFVHAAAGLPTDLARRVEVELCANVHYEYCTRLGQLAPVEVVPAPAEAYRIYTDRLTARSQRLGDIKPSALSPHSGWREVFATARA